MWKRILAIALLGIMVLSGCGINSTDEKTTITVAAAASMKNVLENEIIPGFTKNNPNIGVISTYDSSGKLQVQIEEGAEIDVFLSAATKQMNALVDQSLIDQESVMELLENKIVLILPKESTLQIKSFHDLLNIEHVAVGDPESVPAGQYAKELLVNLNLWENLSASLSLGTNVTEVLNWVSSGSAEAGIVYATDAASSDAVKVALNAPEGTVSKIIYPVGVTSQSKNINASEEFLSYLTSEEAGQAFIQYGFSPQK